MRSRSTLSGVFSRILSIAPWARATRNCVCPAIVSSRNCRSCFITGESNFFMKSVLLVQRQGGIGVLSSQEGKCTLSLRRNSSRGGKSSSKVAVFPAGNQIASRLPFVSFNQILWLTFLATSAGSTSCGTAKSVALRPDFCASGCRTTASVSGLDVCASDGGATSSNAPQAGAHQWDHVGYLREQFAEVRCGRSR